FALVDAVGLDFAVQRREAHGKGRFREPIARDERRTPEPARLEALGKALQHADLHHVTADPGYAPAGEVEFADRGIAGPPLAEIVAEGWAEGESAAIFGDQPQPSQRPSGEIGGSEVIDRHLRHERRQAEPDEAHVMVERQPRYAPVALVDFQAVVDD